VNTLSENPDVKVGLIEAGVLHSENDPVVYMPRSFAGPGNPDYDWAFATEPQTHAQGRVIPAPRYIQVVVLPFPHIDQTQIYSLHW
jgi:hypothetical protein